MAFAADYSVEHYLEGNSASMDWTERVFLILYTIEFVLKIWRFHWYYFCDESWKFNWLDVFLLVLSYYFEFVSNLFANVAWLRVLRILKIAKALRVLRLVVMFKALRAILMSMVSTIDTLIWSLVMLTVILFVISLIFVARTGSYLNAIGSDVDLAQEQQRLNAFGSVGVTMVNMFAVATGGDDWINYYRILIEASYIDAAIFLAFVAFTQIALLNIILGIFVDRAMKNLLAEKEEAALAHAEGQAQCAADLEAFLFSADESDTGFISVAAWRAIVLDGRVNAYLDMVGLHIKNAIDYFQFLADAHGGQVPIDQFVRGCMRYKGDASAYDMMVLLSKLDQVCECLENHDEWLRILMKRAS